MQWPCSWESCLGVYWFGLFFLSSFLACLFWFGRGMMCSHLWWKFNAETRLHPSKLNPKTLIHLQVIQFLLWGQKVKNSLATLPQTLARLWKYRKCYHNSTVKCLSSSRSCWTQQKFLAVILVRSRRSWSSFWRCSWASTNYLCQANTRALKNAYYFLDVPLFYILAVVTRKHSLTQTNRQYLSRDLRMINLT